jgi:hypothetical protein
MRIWELYELAEELKVSHRGAGRVERGQRLDSSCLATGYGRQYAIKVLRAGHGCQCAGGCPGRGGTARGTGPRSRSAGRPPNQSESGCVIFQICDGATPAKFQYQPDAGFGSRAEWTIG